MGWRELRGWLRAMNRLRREEAGRERTDPDSWEGYQNDSFWAEARERHRRMRGY